MELMKSGLLSYIAGNINGQVNQSEAYVKLIYELIISGLTSCKYKEFITKV